MTIWLLSEKDDVDLKDWAKVRGGDGWYSPFSHAHGFVVIASSEQEARSMAAKEREYEMDWWLDPNATDCVPLVDDGQPRVVLGDWPTG